MADAACQCWRAAFAGLTPVIGQQGVVALYKRALHLSRAEHAGLAALYAQSGSVDDELARLHALLAQQAPAEAVAIQAMLFGRFSAVLGQLIGPALATRLLQPLGASPSSGAAAKDPSS